MIYDLRFTNRERGFTIIEMLAGIVVFVAIGTVITAIMVSALRGNSKTNTINTVRQNGNSAITQMAKMIRDARSLNTPYPCTTPPASPYTSLTITSFDGGQTTFSCSSSVIASQSGAVSIPLIDSAVVTFPSPTPSPAACYFTCTQSSSSDYPTVGITFYLKQKNPGIPLFTEQTSTTIPFQTTVTLRNLNR